MMDNEINEGTIDDLKVLQELGLMRGDGGDRRDTPTIVPDRCIDTLSIARRVSEQHAGLPASDKAEIYSDMVHQEAETQYCDYE